MSGEPTIFFNPYRARVPNGQVFIRSPSNLHEWLYIEIQAEIKSTIFTNIAYDDESYHYLWDQPLGSYHEKDGVPTLRVGNLEMFGKKVKLEKPYLIIQRPNNTIPTQHNVLTSDDISVTIPDAVAGGVAGGATGGVNKGANKANSSSENTSTVMGDTETDQNENENENVNRNHTSPSLGTTSTLPSTFAPSSLASDSLANDTDHEGHVEHPMPSADANQEQSNHETSTNDVKDLRKDLRSLQLSAGGDGVPPKVLNVIGLIRTKISFTQRPVPIVLTLEKSQNKPR